MGDLRFVGSSDIKISGFRAFDGVYSGVYSIEKVTHSVSGSYTTKLDLSMAKESKEKGKTGRKKSTSSDVVNSVYFGERQVLISPDGG